MVKSKVYQPQDIGTKLFLSTKAQSISNEPHLLFLVIDIFTSLIILLLMKVSI